MGVVGLTAAQSLTTQQSSINHVSILSLQRKCISNQFYNETKTARCSTRQSVCVSVCVSVCPTKKWCPRCGVMLVFTVCVSVRPRNGVRCVVSDSQVSGSQLSSSWQGSSQTAGPQICALSRRYKSGSNSYSIAEIV